MSVSSQPRRRLGPDVGATTLPNHAASRGILVEQHEQNSNHDVLPGSLLQPSNDTIRSESRDTSHPGPFHMHNTEAAANLAFFRDEMSQTFPFFVLLPTTVPEELLSFRPITFWAIMAVSSRKYMAQVAIREWLSRELSDRVSMKGERSIDLLLGTLIYTAWFVFHSLVGCSINMRQERSAVFGQTCTGNRVNYDCNDFGLRSWITSASASRTSKSNGVRELCTKSLERSFPTGCKKCGRETRSFGCLSPEFNV